MTAIKQISSNKIFRGLQKTFSHFSNELSCEMKFSIYLPEQTEGDQKVPVLYWLSGLTCTEENFVIKAGAQRYAAEHGLIIVCPDTSPRNVEIPGQDDSYDFGSGAGFYVDATTDLWKKNYRMFSYVTSELIDVINANFPTNGQQSIFGHSMGGHGAIICALKNPGLYKSVSAFAPIANPTNCSWGKKALTGYLGSDENTWKEYDSCELVKKYNGPPLEIFIDQGKADEFLGKQQLLPENLVNSCKDSQVPVILNMREGYDHGYFFVSTFVGEHIAYHARFLK